MSWVSPRTWSVGEVFSAGTANVHIRDNLNETMPAKVTTAGDLAYGTAANAIARLAPGTSLHVLRMAGVGFGSGTAPAWGPVVFPHRTLTGDGTLTYDDSMVLFNAASGTVTLPTVRNGLYYSVMKINSGGGNVSIVATGGALINERGNWGAGTVTIAAQGGAKQIYSNGTAFYVGGTL